MPSTSQKLSDEEQTRLAMAALFVALVRTLEASDPSAPSRAEAELKKLYNKMRDYPSQPIGAFETLRWAGELLREPD